MHDDSSDAYHRLWEPREYLRQYYTTEGLAEDEQAIADFLTRKLRDADRRFSRALEFGCGPTVHHAAILAPYVDELHLADYLPENLAEVRKWLDGSPGAHDWDGQLMGVLTIEDPAGDLGARLDQRKRDLRRAVTELKSGDARRQPSVAGGGSGGYDLIATFFTVECVDADKAAWERNLANVCTLVRPGGVFTCATLRRANEYHVFDRTFPTAHVDEGDYARVLSAYGFDPARTTADGIEIRQWAEQGFDGICIIWAEKPPE
jgi:SAM-dependent methyltransferase